MSKLVPFLAVFAGLVLIAIVVPGEVETLRFAMDFDQFTPTTATVTSTRSQAHGKGPTTGVVEYEFVAPDGALVQGDNSITRIADSPELIDELVKREGGVDRITVYFDPRDPRRSVIHEVGFLQPIGFIGLALLLLVGGLHASYIDRQRRRLQARADAARRR